MNISKTFLLFAVLIAGCIAGNTGVYDHDRAQINASKVALLKDPRNFIALNAIANSLYNLNYGKPDRTEEINFYNQCIKDKQEPLSLWYIRKARALCQMSVGIRWVDNNEQRTQAEVVTDREQYEESFLCLQKAYANNPDFSIYEDYLFNKSAIDAHFPLLHEEKRFESLFRKP